MFMGQSITSATTSATVRAAANRAAMFVHEAQSRSFLGSVGHGIVVIILVIFFTGLVIGLVVGFLIGRLFNRRR
ncbi:MAG TPA: hypothetical protein VHZ97_01910 [Pseudonocardiaceae bacterium]|nr:hypothetical protein [Pseudonocardiaceae bacterium]